MSKQTLQEFISEIEGEAMKVKSNYYVNYRFGEVAAHRVVVTCTDLDMTITIGYSPNRDKNEQLAKCMLDFIVDKLKNEAINEATNEVV